MQERNGYRENLFCPDLTKSNIMYNGLKSFISSILNFHPWKFSFSICLVVLSGLTEGLALTSVLPLLTSLDSTGGISPPENSNIIFSALNKLTIWLHLPTGPIGSASLIVIFVALSGAFFLAQARILSRLQFNYVVHLQKTLFKNLLAAGPRVLETSRSGELVSALVTEASRVSGAFYHLCIVLASMLNLIIFATVAFFISIKITVSVLLIGSLLFAMTRPLLKKAYSYGEKISQLQSEIHTLSSETLSQIKSIKIANVEEIISSDFQKHAQELGNNHFANAFDIQKARAVFEFGGAIGVSLVIVLGAFTFNIQTATIIVILAIFVRLLPRVTALQQGIQALNNLLPSKHTIDELNDLAYSLRERNGPNAKRIEFKKQPPSIKLSKVTVKKQEKFIIKDVDIFVPAGTFTAIVGLSGAGKSTIIDVCTGITKIESGGVYFNEQELSELQLCVLREQIGYVGQTNYLFSGTVKQNISFGRPVSNHELRKGISMASAEFVWGLENGIDTPIGEKGVNLSSGERQRISLARAFSSPRNMYFLDEATSALDSETEGKIIEAISELKGNSTIVMVAHRFSALKNADFIYVVRLDGGGCMYRWNE